MVQSHHLVHPPPNLRSLNTVVAFVYHQSPLFRLFRWYAGSHFSQTPPEPDTTRAPYKSSPANEYQPAPPRYPISLATGRRLLGGRFEETTVSKHVVLAPHQEPWCVNPVAHAHGTVRVNECIFGHNSPSERCLDGSLELRNDPCQDIMKHACTDLPCHILS